MNYNKCHLSKPVYRRSNQSREDYLLERKEYFNNNLKDKVVIYDGKETRLVFSNINDDRCFYKFAAGSEENHKDKDGNLGIDEKRLERLDWIFEIVERIEECRKCGSFILLNDKRYKNRINIYCIFESYKIVIIIHKGEIQNEIITAYYIRKSEERKKARKKAHKLVRF